MTVWPGLVGPTYQLRSLNVDAERCMNLYPEAIGIADYYTARIMGRDAGGSKTVFALYVTPGFTSAVTLSGPSVPGLFAQDGRAFAVSGSTFYELTVSVTGTVSATSRGTLAQATQAFPVPTICSNGTGGNQLFITSGGYGYIYSLTANTLTLIADTAFPQGAALVGGFTDSYFLVLVANSAKFQISAEEDGTTWNVLGVPQVGQREDGSDLITSMVVDHREVWLFGNATAEAWIDTGATFPFAPIQGSFSQVGTSSAFGPCALGGTVYFIGQSPRGERVAYALNASTPERVSTYAVEQVWSTYATTADAQSYAYEQGGHTFWVINFPSANATWVFDIATQMWHQRGHWDATMADYARQLPMSHCFAWGTTHLVGDRASGNVYALSLSTYAENGAPLRWERQTVHLSTEQKRNVHHRLQVDLQVGQGLVTGQGSNPQVMLQWSNDGGQTWSNEYWQSAGVIGAYNARVIWRRLGHARDRVYRVAGSDPVFTALATAYLDVTPGLS